MTPDKQFSVRRLAQNEEIPYNLLLLADETMEAINRYIHHSEIYLCERNNKIIAAFVLMIVADDSVEIKNIAVEPAFQNRGIGTYLLNYAFENARERGFKSLLIGTGDNSLRQLQLYQKCGFARFKTIKDFYIDNYPEPIYENGKQLIDMIVLRKQI